MAVRFRVCVGALDDDRPFDGSASKEALCAAVRVHGSDTALCGEGARPLDVPPERTRRDRHVAPEGEAPRGHEALDGRARVEDDEELCELDADLEAEACAGGADCRGGGPGAVFEAGDDDACAGPPAEEEAGFGDREEAEALCLAEDRGRDDVVEAIDGCVDVCKGQ